MTRSPPQLKQEDGHGQSRISDTPNDVKCAIQPPNKSANSNSSLTSDTPPNELPEKEEYQIELRKDTNGLGITIAGYVCEKGKNFYFYFFFTSRIKLGSG